MTTKSVVTTILAPLPKPVCQACRDQWRPAYLARDRWTAAISA